MEMENRIRLSTLVPVGGGSFQEVGRNVRVDEVRELSILKLRILLFHNSIPHAIFTSFRLPNTHNDQIVILSSIYVCRICAEMESKFYVFHEWSLSLSLFLSFFLQRLIIKSEVLFLLRPLPRCTVKFIFLLLTTCYSIKTSGSRKTDAPFSFFFFHSSSFLFFSRWKPMKRECTFLHSPRGVNPAADFHSATINSCFSRIRL